MTQRSSTTAATQGALTPGPGDGAQGRFAYKWVVLSCTTLGVLMAMINASSLLIALPAIFRGIHLSPLDPGNFTYLLWILMGYGLVSAAFVVTAGRVGDMFGRVRMYKIGFIIFTASALGLSLVLEHGRHRRDRDHRLPHGPGHRRRHDDGQLGGHPHRRLPRG